MNQARTFHSRLLAAGDECPGVRTFRFQTPEGFRFTPGMWVMLHFSDKPKESRAYSIASSPLDTGYIELSLCKVGELTRRLFGLAPGDSVVIKGPYGKWVYDDQAAHAVLISEGTGLTPFRSMCRYVIGRKLPNRLTLLYSARTEAEQLYRGEYEHWRRHGIAVHVSAGRHVDIASVEQRVPDLQEPQFYLCGAQSLIENLTSALAERGVPKERIHYEKWGVYSF